MHIEAHDQDRAQKIPWRSSMTNCDFLNDIDPPTLCINNVHITVSLHKSMWSWMQHQKIAEIDGTVLLSLNGDLKVHFLYSHNNATSPVSSEWNSIFIRTDEFDTKQIEHSAEGPKRPIISMIKKHVFNSAAPAPNWIFRFFFFSRKICYFIICIL